MSKLKIIAGPCVVESFELLDETARFLTEICKKLDVDFYFKSSYKKANRTSVESFSGIGDKIALRYLADIREKYSVSVLTDIHSIDEVSIAAEYVDVLQIPAFLCRQTELIVAAAKTGKIVNIKKGQFLAPQNMKQALDKALSVGNQNIWLTERGTCFGYNDLVVDFRSLLIMKSFGKPVIFDATHSMQKPSVGVQSGGTPEYTESLAKAAIAVGADGIFFETHPEPKNAKSDSATQLPLKEAERFIKSLVNLKIFLDNKR